jgi:AcrR family transcriptional regulator
MTDDPEKDRRTRILDAAEEAFATLGYEGASLRQIAAGAGVNLAAAYYYFGSKEGLFKEVMERRFEPLKQQHLQALRSAAEAARGKPLPVAKILEALILPPVCRAAQAGNNPSIAQRLIGRMVTEPNRACQELLAQIFSEVREEFMAALRLSLPKVSDADLFWRLEFIWGAIAFILCNPSRIETLTRGACTLADAPTVAGQMLEFFSAGFKPLQIASRNKAARRSRPAI